MSLRVGLFGGTFDPPHSGHLTVALDALEALDLDEVVLVPAAVPPHKPEHALTPASLRMEMVMAAVADTPGLGASDAELSREGPSYTVDTLRRMRADMPDADLTFIMGADQLAELAVWKEPEQVASLAKLAVMNRGDVAPTAPNLGLALEWTEVAVTPMEVSSTLVRRLVSEGRPVGHLVPPSVLRIIEREKLYCNG